MATRLYWLHLPEHCEPDKEGYIGVSGEPEKRWVEHKRRLRQGIHENIHLTHAYLLYGPRIIQSVIDEGPEDYCYTKELSLRPRKDIGWNHNIGGTKPPSLRGIPKSAEHKRKVGEANKISLLGNTNKKGKKTGPNPAHSERMKKIIKERYSNGWNPTLGKTWKLSEITRQKQRDRWARWRLENGH